MEIAKNITEISSAESRMVGRNFLWMSWSGFISIANSLLIWIFMARLRDVDEVGRFTIVMGLYSLFYTIVSLGLMPYLVNEISRRSVARVESESSVAQFVSSSFVFLTFSGVLSTILMSSGGFLVSNSWQVRISTIVLSLAMIPSGIGAVFEANAVAHGRVRLVAIVSTVENLIRTIVPLGLIWFGYDIFSICVAFASVRFIAILVYFVAGQFRVSEIDFSYKDFREIARVCPTFAGTVTASSINWQAPLFMLGYLSSEAASAEFGAASRFLIPVTILMSSYGNVLQPSLAKYKNESAEKYGRYLGKMAVYPVIAAAAIALGSVLFSRQALTILFGETYQTAAPVLNLLALSVIPYCLVIVAARGLVAINSARVDLAGNILGVVICISAGAILIPRYGAVGAAASHLISFLSIAALSVGYLARRTGGAAGWKTTSWSSAALILMSAFLWKM